MIRNVIFDFDGTLLDASESIIGSESTCLCNREMGWTIAQRIF